MKKILAAAASLALAALVLAGCQGKNTGVNAPSPQGAGSGESTAVGKNKASGKAQMVENLEVGGVKFILGDVEEKPVLRAADIPANYDAFNVTFTFGDGADDVAASCEELYQQGYFLAPDGEEYKPLGAFQGDDGSFYTLSAGVPADTDVATLVLVYQDQHLPLG